jgi:hypothetical protein
MFPSEEVICTGCAASWEPILLDRHGRRWCERCVHNALDNTYPPVVTRKSRRSRRFAGRLDIVKDLPVG